MTDVPPKSVLRRFAVQEPMLLVAMIDELREEASRALQAPDRAGMSDLTIGVLLGIPIGILLSIWAKWIYWLIWEAE